MKEKTKSIVGVVLRVIIALTVFLLVLINYKKLVELDVRILVENASSVFAAGAVIVGIYALKSVVFVVPASLIYISVGMSFDVATALIINLIGLAVEITITYFFGLFLGGEYVNRLLEKNKGGRKLLSMKQKTKTSFLLIARAVPAFPIDFTSLFLGASRFNFASYFFISILGIYPRIAIFTALGDGMYKFIPKELLIKAVIIIIPVAVCGYVIYRIVKKKKETLKSEEPAVTE